MKIIVEENYSGYTARAEYQGKDLSGFGDTLNQAIGSMIRNHQRVFGITEVTYRDIRGEYTPGEC